MQRVRKILRQLLFPLMILGPGLVTASAGNDVGGIATYSAAGARFGYSITWTLIILFVPLIVVQLMAARMGAVTGKGLAALIRENFGVRLTFVAMLMLFLVNTGITATEFAGIGAASELYHISRYISVPVAALLTFLVVLRTNRKVMELIFVTFSLLYLSYVASAILAHPDWHATLQGAFVPTFSTDTAFIVTVVGIIGTTISPYMQFFLQSQIVDAGSGPRDLPAVRLDVIIGSILGIAIGAFMIVANAATIYHANQTGHHLPFDISSAQASDFAVALRPLAGPFAYALYSLGILNAGLFTATVLPLATAFVICEALGFEAGLDNRFSEARIFYVLFAAAMLLGAALVLIPGLPLFAFIFYAQVLQGILLPLELVLMLVLANRARVMGSFVNTRVGNVLGWGTAAIIGSLALIYVVQQLRGGS